jgi:NTP pyrophosphatase (non-canonical NTP hydrolase)
MKLDQFVTDATRTESRIEQVTLNADVFNDLVTALVSVGTILDQVKKNTFYKKPYKISEIQDLIRKAQSSLDSVAFVMHDQEFPNEKFDTTTAVDPRIFHSVVGIATEAVELLQAITLDSNIVDEVNLREEFGDLLWYIAIGVDKTGGNFDGIFEKVIAKLKARFGDKFTSDRAINRDLVTERAILEGKE